MHRRRLRLLVPLLAVLAATLAAAPPAAAGGGCHRPASEGRGTTLTMEELCIVPTVLRVDPGSEVTIVNRDVIDHPLARVGRDWYWEGTAGTRTAIRLDRAGTYPFVCYLHPGMVGVVVVGDGRSTGSEVVQVTAPPAETGEAAGTGQAAGTEPARSEAVAGAQPVAGGRPVPSSFPAAWIVLVALAALVGAAVGTRLVARGRRDR
jgi:plastocyanin